MQYSKNKDKKKQKKAAAAAAEPPAKKEKPRYQKNEPERATNDEDHADADEFDTDEPNPNKADGMADMMAKILGQNVGDKVFRVFVCRSLSFCFLKLKLNSQFCISESCVGQAKDRADERY